MKTSILILFACVLGALAKTECEEHRDRELETDVGIKFVPTCDENGNYETKQCFGDSSFCMCLRPNGTYITAPSRNLKTCACHSHRDNVILQGVMPGTFVPSCEDDGTYSQQQCSGSTGMCWCADEAGNSISEQTRGLKSCTCHAHKNREVLKQKSGIIGNFIPRCEVDGTYSKKQCHGSIGMCWCANATGDGITKPSRKLKSCECHSERHRELLRSNDGVKGNFIPSCEEDGSYSQLQCNPSTGYCWCATESGKRIIKGTRRLYSCACHNERHKQLEFSKQGMVGQFIPSCEGDGTFSRMQCHGSTGYCWCANVVGDKINEETRDLKSCECHSHRYREVLRSKNGIIGNFVPRCEADGTYSRKQCHGSTGMCWCADEAGREITNMTRDDIEC